MVLVLAVKQAQNMIVPPLWFTDGTRFLSRNSVDFSRDQAQCFSFKPVLL